MGWQLTADLEAFDTAAGGFLRARPIANTVMLTLIGTLRRRGLWAYGSEAPFFGTWSDPRGVVAGALLQTPPHPVLFSAAPPEAVSAAVAVLDGRPLPGVNLPAGDVDSFVPPWRARTGVTATVRMRTRLYRLETLVPPASVALCRPAREADRPLLVTWLGDFFAEIGDSREGAAELVDDRLAAGMITVAEAGGALTSMAVRTSPAAGTVRIQSVFTPPDRRGRGYAGGATAFAARAAREAGADEVVLNTDLANPTSNALYQRLGFRPVEDRTVVAFS